MFFGLGAGGSSRPVSSASAPVTLLSSRLAILRSDGAAMLQTGVTAQSRAKRNGCKDVGRSGARRGPKQSHHGRLSGYVGSSSASESSAPFLTCEQNRQR